MAPISLSDDLALSSLELDSQSSPDQHVDIPRYLESLSLPEREALSVPPSVAKDNLLKRSDTGLDVLVARDASSTTTSTATSNPLSGSVPPSEINNKGVQAVFALIGASFVLGAIWFFFWAKNGGFQWRRTDWDDYKSTVLRRKGPDGKTLSNATKSTKLGGGSIVGSRYRDFDDDELTMGMSEITKAASSDTRLTGGSRIAGAGKRIKRMRERMAEKKAKKSAAVNVKKATAGKKSHNEKHASRHHNSRDEDNSNNDETLRAYKKEKPARVGGLNKESDGQGTVFYGSTDYSNSDTASSYNPSSYNNNHHHHQRTTSSSAAAPPKRYSGTPPQRSSPRHASPEKRQSSSSAHLRQSAAATHDFGHRSSPRHSRQSSPTKGAAGPRRSMPGSYADPLDFNSADGASNSSEGTKSYHHPIPELSGNRGVSGGAGAGGGWRRGRRDSLGS